MTALWTEACLTFPALDAAAAATEVYVVADAVGGTSSLLRNGAPPDQQAGGKMISVRSCSVNGTGSAKKRSRPS